MNTNGFKKKKKTTYLSKIMRKYFIKIVEVMKEPKLN